MTLLEEIYEEQFFWALSPGFFERFVHSEKEIDQHWEDWLNLCLLHHLQKRSQDDRRV